MTATVDARRRQPALRSGGPQPDDDVAPTSPVGLGRRGGGLALLALVLAGVCVASIAVGARSIDPGTVWEALWSFDPANNDHLVVRSLRIPRTLLGLLVGSGLGVAGTVMQGVTRNPLADPGIFGVNGGAALAVVIGIFVFGITSPTGYVWLAFAGAAVASAVVYGLGALGRGGATPVKLALAGAAMAALLQALTTTVLLVDLATLDQYRFWAVGSLAGRNADVVGQIAPFAVAGLAIGLASATRLNVLALGDDLARSLGQNVHAARALSATAIVVCCGSAVAAAGPIGFIGLTVPHIARAIVGPDYRWIIAWSILLGPTVLLGADVIGRVVARPEEIQVGIVTAFVGAPFFMLLVRRRKLAEL